MLRALTLAFALAIVPAAAADRTPAPEDAKVYFIAPADGATVESPLRVVFGLRGMGVAPAGVAIPDTGHHHLLINAEIEDAEAPIPADERHIHFGLGQTETVIELAPGTYTLRLVLGDYLHRPHDPPVESRPVTITVR